MRVKWPRVAVVLGVLCWAALCYVLRYTLMENIRWVGLCYADPANPFCALRANLGWMIHFQVLPMLALALALPAFVLRDRPGRGLAYVALLLSLPALALYTATPAAFALLLSLLRLVRARAAAGAA